MNISLSSRPKGEIFAFSSSEPNLLFQWQWVVAPTGESLFLQQPKKTNEKKAALTPCPAGSRALSLCQRVGSTRSCSTNLIIHP